MRTHRAFSAAGDPVTPVLHAPPPRDDGPQCGRDGSQLHELDGETNNIGLMNKAGEISIRENRSEGQEHGAKTPDSPPSHGQHDSNDQCQHIQTEHQLALELDDRDQGQVSTGGREQ